MILHLTLTMCNLHFEENAELPVPEFVFDPANVKWKRWGKFKPKPYQFTEDNPGYQSTLTEHSTELDFFKEIVSPDIVQKIADETNSFKQFVGDQAPLGRVSEHSSVNLRKDIDVSELYLFLGLWFLIAVHGLNDMKEAWSTRSILHIPIFSQLMSRNRFLAILRFLHFSSNLDQTNGDRMLY